MSIACTLNGTTATHVRMTIPAWGVSWHDVTLDGDVPLSGSVTLVVADLTVKATVMSGGPSGTGRSFYRVAAGAGGWGQTIPAKAYANDAGVKIANVVNDAAQACGEAIDQTTIPDGTVGSYFTRPEGPASRVLEQLFPSGWYVGEDGVTRIGQRAATTLQADTTRTTPLDLARGTVTLASETIANILPGLSVDGLTAVDVEHTIDVQGGLRSKVWGDLGSSNSRRLDALRAIVEQLDPDRAFRGITEYRIVTQEGNRLNLQPIRVSTGMPSLSRVMVRPGLPGFSASHCLGARVLVRFVNADPAAPVVTGFEDADGPGFLPTSSSLDASSTLEIGPTASAVAVAGGGPPVVRLGDAIKVFLSPTLPLVGTVTGTVSGPFAGFVSSPPLPPVSGIVVAGSSKATSG